MKTTKGIQRIDTRQKLLALAKKLGVRDDWHEPDEQGVSATVRGTSFDNAGFWGLDYEESESGHFAPVEKYVILKKDGKPIAQVNLATLFAFATGYEGEDRP